MSTESYATSRRPHAALGDDLAAAGVTTFFGFYVDAHGVPKSKAVPIGHLQDAAAGSELYTVGALEGMGRLGPNEDEVRGHPDMDRVVVLPWDRRYAMAPADLRFHGEPYSHDSRHVLKRQLAAAAELGYRFNTGVEPEVYVLREVDGRVEPLVPDDLRNAPTRGYDVDATMLADAFLEPMVRHIDELGWGVYSFDHEGGDGQYEFDFGFTDGLEMADRMVLFRLMCKHVARSLGCFATFMPKPFSDSFGSGAHVNMSLESLATGENAFVTGASANGAGGGREGRDPRYTDLAYRFAAGVVRHGAAITALACPTVNSYKRLLPRGLMDEISWAPVYRAWGINNRTLMVRLPGNRPCIELRTADAAANFYLVSALTLAAGLEGIREGIDPGEACNVDTYTVDDAELARRGVHRLPSTLGDAIAAFEADPLARDVMGAGFHADYVALKRGEWDAYNTVVSEWEREQYLHLW